MQFGTKYSGDKGSSNTSSGGSGTFLRTFKEGDTQVRILHEMNDWDEYWEHYNPTGYSFPCTGDRDTCPGCTSDNERMKQASKKIVFSALVGEYVNAYKIPRKLANRLEARADRNGGTITDRDYVITRIGMDKDTDWDLEGRNAVEIDLSAYERVNVQKVLEESFREAWPDFEADQFMEQAEQKSSEPAKPAGSTKQLPPPSEPVTESASAGEQGEDETEYTIDDLKKMTPEQLRDLCKASGAEVPNDLTTQAEIVGWMEKTFA